MDQFLSGMTYCVTSDFGAAKLMGGKRQEKEVDLMFEKGLDRRPHGEKSHDDEVFFPFGLLHGAVSIASNAKMVGK